MLRSQLLDRRRPVSRHRPRTAAREHRRQLMSRKLTILSDDTLIPHCGPMSGGTELTLDACRQFGKRVRLLDAATVSTEEGANIARACIDTRCIRRLNVAGPRASRRPVPRLRPRCPRPWLRAAWLALLLAGSVCVSVAAAAERKPDAAAALRARHAALHERLEHSPFPQHIYVESFEGPSASRGDVYAVVDYPIATVSDALTSPAHWCDLLVLHLNVKYCHPVSRDGHTVLSVAIGRKHDQPLISTFRVEFDFSVAASRPGYLDIELNASQGPLGTGNYRISLEAVGLEQQQAFVHLQYSYTHDSAARAAMRMYLATTGRGKVGFTMIGEPNDPQPQFMGGVRGAIERNTMRYYLAIDAYLGTLTVPAPGRFEQSIERWFDATERYSRQLHEIDRDAYLEMKRSEYQRQQTLL